jgi:hypothetical protein
MHGDLSETAAVRFVYSLDPFLTGSALADHPIIMVTSQLPQ